MQKDRVSQRPHDYLGISHLHDDLRGRTARNAVVTVVSQVGKLGIHLGSMSVLARLLSPEDFGFIGMVTAITGIIAIFGDMGLSLSTIQTPELHHKQASSLFWVNVCIGGVTTVLCMALAPLVAWFYGQAILKWITIGLAPAFLMSGLAVQHNALLRRQMQFKRVSMVDLISITFGVVVGILAAWTGAGYWALVVQMNGIAIAKVVCCWLFCSWRPSAHLRRTGTRGFLSFGGFYTGSTVINYFSRNLDKILIGRSFGAEQLGYYTRAYSLLLLPLTQILAPISAVAIPALSRLQNNAREYKRLYLDMLQVLSFVSAPLAIFLIGMSENLIVIVLGPQWAPASKVFAALGVSAVIQSIFSSQGWIFVSSGRTDRMLIWILIQTLVICAAFFIGLPYGAVGVALCYSIAVWLLTIPAISFAGAPVGITGWAALGVVWPSILSAAVAGSLAWFVIHMGIAGSNKMLQVLVFLAVMAPSYLACLILVHRSTYPIKQIVRLVQILIGKRSAVK
jgi:PST family polysaccharide transporter